MGFPSVRRSHASLSADGAQEGGRGFPEGQRVLPGGPPEGDGAADGGDVTSSKELVAQLCHPGGLLEVFEEIARLRDKIGRSSWQQDKQLGPVSQGGGCNGGCSRQRHSSSREASARAPERPSALHRYRPVILI